MWPAIQRTVESPRTTGDRTSPRRGLNENKCRKLGGRRQKPMRRPHHSPVLLQGNMKLSGRHPHPPYHLNDCFQHPPTVLTNSQPNLNPLCNIPKEKPLDFSSHSVLLFLNVPWPFNLNAYCKFIIST
ncbi:unnamed protein product [Allacma fusca]|uniref:Uncharacterized protein n=1 Tax=Allacma fusca TaxID=39272 RepID=A0A8J2PCD0_9HEXA|nr:unnamed protein product [Allacma fusca]